MENPGSQSQSSNLPRKKCFQCTICKALFSQSWNCVSHMQSHIRVKPSLMCPSCGKLCSKKSELNIHVRIHTGEKPFVCKECKASFVRRGHLKEHMRRHTGERPYLCTVCGTTFGCSSNLKRHAHLHSVQLLHKGGENDFASRPNASESSIASEFQDSGLALVPSVNCKKQEKTPSEDFTQFIVCFNCPPDKGQKEDLNSTSVLQDHTEAMVNYGTLKDTHNLCILAQKPSTLNVSFSQSPITPGTVQSVEPGARANGLCIADEADLHAGQEEKMACTSSVCNANSISNSNSGTVSVTQTGMSSLLNVDWSVLLEDINASLQIPNIGSQSHAASSCQSAPVGLTSQSSVPFSLTPVPENFPGEVITNITIPLPHIPAPEFTIEPQTYSMENISLFKEPFGIRDKTETEDRENQTSSGQSVTMVCSENQNDLHRKESAAKNSNSDNLAKKQAIGDISTLENPGSQSQSSKLSRRKLYHCTICKAHFSQSWNYVSHMQSHVCIKPNLTCPSCGKLAIKKSEQDLHTRIYTGEKPYLCTECGTTFGCSSSLKHHVNLHNTPLLAKERKNDSAPGQNASLLTCSEAIELQDMGSTLVPSLNGVNQEKKACESPSELIVYINSPDKEHKQDRNPSNLLLNQRAAMVNSETLKDIYNPCILMQHPNTLNMSVSQSPVTPGTVQPAEPGARTSSLCIADDADLPAGQEEGKPCTSSVCNANSISNSNTGIVSVARTRMSSLLNVDWSMLLDDINASLQTQNPRPQSQATSCSSAPAATDFHPSLPFSLTPVPKDFPDEIIANITIPLPHISAPEFTIQPQVFDEAAITPVSAPISEATQQPQQQVVMVGLKNSSETSNICTNLKPTVMQDQPPQVSKENLKGKPWQCDMCDATFSRNWYLTVHRKAHLRQKSYCCDVCGVKFPRIGNLNRHRRVHTGEKPFHCEICNSHFGTKYRLTEHLRRHKGLKPYKCEICGGTFTDSSSLRRHQRTHEGENLQHTCDVCGARFATSHSLTFHFKIHNPEDELSENLNKGIMMDAKESTARDMRVIPVEEAGEEGTMKIPCVLKQTAVNGTVKYSCSVCSKMFCFSAACRQHIMCHTGSRPFKCRTCGAKFSRKADAKRHTAVHTRVNPYACAECGESYFTKSRLALHAEQHVPKTQLIHACRECSEKFSRRTVLRIHQQSHLGWKQCKATQHDSIRSKNDEDSGVENDADMEEGDEQIVKFGYRLANSGHGGTSCATDNSPDIVASCQLQQDKMSHENLLMHKTESEIERVPNRTQNKFSNRENSTDMKLTLKKNQSEMSEVVVETTLEQSEEPLMGNRGRIPKREAAKKQQEFLNAVVAQIRKKSLLTSITLNQQNGKASSISASRRQAYKGKSSTTSKAWSFSCSLCNVSYTSRSQLRVHKQTHAEKTFRCPHCPSAFAAKRDLEEHSLVHSMKQNYKCGECGITMVTKKSFQAHQKLHTKKKDQCKLQVLGSFRKCDRLLEEMKHDLEVKGIVFRCNVCKMQVESQTALTEHLATHHQCMECGIAFHYACDLLVHMRTHTGERPYHCAECGAAFSKNSQLKVHSRKHVGAKLLSCRYCGASFSRLNFLTQHEQKHIHQKISVATSS